MKKEEISLKNTKAEILEALNEALEREKNANKMKSNPEKEEKEKKVQKAIETSRTNVEQNIFSVELINKFKDLELAIKTEEEKLKELYDIDGEMAQLTLIVNAGKDFIADIEERKKSEELKLNQTIQSLEEEFKRKNDELQKEFDLKAKNLKLEREREIEEYNYRIKREREISTNQWEDEKKKREKLLAELESETKKLAEDIKIKDNYYKELEEKVSSIPTVLEKEYERGKREITAELDREHNYATELLKKDFQNTIDRQNDQIKSLQLELEKERNLSATLQEKMDKAYLEIKELATKTVETSGGVKILGSNTSNEVK